MDGLLLDTEPLWGESMMHVARQYGIELEYDFLRFTTGLRIYEVTQFWQQKIGWEGKSTSVQLAEDILDDIIFRAINKGRIMPGVASVLHLLTSLNVKMGIATSSPKRMMDQLINHFQLTHFFSTMVSADEAGYGKPHPQVYLLCASKLNENPWNCLAFEDSVNGMIAAKAARMKVVAVPESEKINDKRFGLADIVLSSLEEFDGEIWNKIES